MTNTVGVTRRIPESGLAFLRDNGCAVVLNPEDRALTPSELKDMASRVDALITQLVDRVDAALLSAAPRVRVVANYAVGYDNIDVSAAQERRIRVTNTPDVLTDATAELAWALLLAAARRVAEGDRLMRAGAFQGWAPLFHLGTSVGGKTLGVVGAGRIGTAVAKRSLGFGMKIVYAARRESSVMEKELNAQRVDLKTLLSQSDFISLHVRLTPETRHMIGEKELARMKPTAVLVNTARGAVIDEEALVRALKERKIFAAGLDVFENEPALSPGLADLPNVVLAPHAGSATVDARDRMARLAAENVVAVLQGKAPLTPVFPL